MAFNRILDFSNGLDFYLGFFFLDTFKDQNYLAIGQSDDSPLTSLIYYPYRPIPG
jgi:hypothetical protein